MVSYIFLCVLSTLALNLIIVDKYDEHLLKDTEVTKDNWYILVLAFLGAPLLLMWAIIEEFIKKEEN